MLLLVLSSLSHAFITNQQEFLPVEEAFQFEAMLDVEPNMLVWQITDGHYLYQKSLGITDANGETVPIEYSEGTDHYDEFFGDSIVYRQLLQLPLDNTAQLPLQVTWQGCADAGLCYPPQTSIVSDSTPLTDSSGTTEQASSSLAQDQSIAERLAGSGLLLNIAAFFVMGLLLAFTPCMLPMLPILTSVITGSKAGGWQGARLGIAFVLPIDRKSVV